MSKAYNNEGEIKNSVLYRYRYSLFFFLYSVAFQIIIADRFEPLHIEEMQYSTLSVDFSYGFASKILPGAIFHAIFGANASETTGVIFYSVILIVFYAGLSVLIGRFLERIMVAYRHRAFVLLLLFASGNYSFSVFTKMFGLIDTFWLLFALLFFFFLDNKYLRYFIPLLFVASLMIHFSAMVFVIMLFAIVLLYRSAAAQTKAERRIYLVIFAISILLSVAAFLILLFGESNTVVDKDTFHRKLQEHGTNFFLYYDYSIFHLHMVTGEPYIPDFVYQTNSVVLRVLYLIYYQTVMSFSLFDSVGYNGIAAFICGICLLLPIVYSVTRFFLYAFKKYNNAFIKLCMLLMTAEFPLLFILGILFGLSIDITRYFAYAFMTMTVSLFTVLYYDSELSEEFLKKTKIATSVAGKIFILSYWALCLAPAL